MSRSPHGERGLKYSGNSSTAPTDWSLPPRGAWIEILRRLLLLTALAVAPPTGSVD